MNLVQVLVRFDDGNELVIDAIGPDVTPMELGFRMSAAIYRVLAGETEQFEGDGVIVTSEEISE